MTIPPGRISDRLGSAEFRLSYFSDVSGFCMVAKRAASSLFECVGVTRGTRREGGRLLDVVGADVQCSVVPGRTAVKGLAVSDYLPLPSCDKTGMAVIAGQADAARWLGELAAAAPAAARASRIANGPALLASTADLLARCAAYLARIPAGRETTDQVSILRDQATEAQRFEADTWCKQKVIIIPDGSIWYEAAALLIAVHQDEVEGQRGLFDAKRADDVRDRRLMLRLQYLASRLANEPGWEWPIVG